MADPTTARSGVLVGVDGSDGSRRALAWAHRFATAFDEPLTALQAWSYPATAGLPGMGDLPEPTTVDARVEEELSRIVVDELGEPGRSVDVAAVRGPASVALMPGPAAALLVVGRRGLEGVAGWLGSVSRRLLEQAPCPVVVVPPEWDRTEIETILVGVDLSPTSTHALGWAAGVAQRLGARVVVVNAYPPLPEHDSRRAEVREQTERDVRAACTPLVDAEVAFDVVVDERVPPTAVTSLADERAADLVVVGRRGTGAVPQVLLGSVAAHTARYSPCPVAVV